MKAVAVKAKQKDSVHLRDIEKPKVTDIPNGKGVLVKVLSVALDGTDRDIVAAKYGNPPQGDDYLIIGHECFGVVEEVGPKVTEFKKGDFVVPTVRRPGTSFYDNLGMQDVTGDEVYYERGINLLHGYMTEYFVESSDYLVCVPDEFKEIGVLTEPVSIVEKAYEHAIDIQRRLKIWRPKKAAVFGAGPLGLMMAYKFRLERLETYVFSLEEAPNFKSELLEEIGAHYVCTKQMSVEEAAKKYGPFDMIMEATGAPQMMVEAADNVAINGVVILASVTPGDTKIEVPVARVNMEFVLGNKVMFGTVNANYHHFSLAVRDLGYGMHLYTGWNEKLITHRVKGLDKFQEALNYFQNSWQHKAIKVVIDIA